MKTAASMVLMMLGLHAVNAEAARPRSRSPAPLELRQGALFFQTRTELLADGWKPMRMPRDEGDEYSGAEKRLIERKYLEVDSCSTDRGSLCILYYQKQTACLRVDTVGEQVSLMRVTRWEFICPDR